MTKQCGKSLDGSVSAFKRNNSQVFLGCSTDGKPIIAKLNQPLKYFTKYDFVYELAKVFNGWNIKVIEPYVFYANLLNFNICTNNGTQYVQNSRGPFNLIRSAYNYFAREAEYLHNKSRKSELSKKAKLIAATYVDRNGNYAYNV